MIRRMLLFLLFVGASAAFARVGEVYEVEHREKTHQRRIFPGVEPQRRPHTLSLIAVEAAKAGVPPPGNPTLRLVRQPMGFVSELYDINLRTGETTVYPGSHAQWKPWRFQLSGAALAHLNNLLTSEAYTGLPHENAGPGLDGTLLFIDLRLGALHHWVLWSASPHEVAMQTPFRIVEREAQQAARAGKQRSPSAAAIQSELQEAEEGRFASLKEMDGKLRVKFFSKQPSR